MKGTWDPHFILSNGEVIGINLSSGAAHEHKSGIEGLRKSLGATGIGGFESTICHTFPELQVYEENDEMILLFLPNKCGEESVIKFTSEEARNLPALSFEEDASLAAAWDSERFGIRAIGKESVDRLKKAVVEPWLDADLSIMLGRFNSFLFKGLFLIRASKVPQQAIDVMNSLEPNKVDNIDLGKYFGLEAIV